MLDKDKLIKYSLFGAGATLITYSLFGAIKRVFARRISIKRTVGMRPTVTPLGGTKDTIAGGVVPALVMKYNPATDNYEFSKLNFTPRSLAEPANSNEDADMAYIRTSRSLSGLNEGVDYFYNQAPFDKYRRDPQHMIHPLDFFILRDAGVIPFDADPTEMDYIPSYDGTNDFVVGYSKPFYTSGTRGLIQVIRPVWAVSFGKNYSYAQAPAYSEMSNSEISEFDDVASRTLYGEWMLSNRGDNGCPREARSICDLERNAILGLVLKRKKIKQVKIPEQNITFKSVIFGPYQKWNGGWSFMSAYLGHMGEKRRKGVDWTDLKKQAVPDYVSRRYNDYISRSFWTLPRLEGEATHFIHPNSLARTDNNGNPLDYAVWMTTTNPEPRNAHKYSSQHPIKIGSAIFIDRARNFK